MDTTALKQLLTVKEACEWASSFLGHSISETNISCLIEYGKVKKYGENGSTQINANDLKNIIKNIKKYQAALNF